MIRKAADRVGEKYGRLVVLDYRRRGRRTELYCQCDCGIKKWIRADQVIDGSTTSCGCYREKNYFSAKDLTGKKFGRLTAVSPTDKRNSNNGSIIWRCDCDCGNKAFVTASDLLSKNSVRSCGCLQKEGAAVHGKKIGAANVDNNVKYGTHLKGIKRDKPLRNNKSGFLGVSFDETRNKWISQIKFQGKNYNLGRYPNTDEGKAQAAEAYQTAKKELHGSFLEWYENRNKEKEET